MKQILDHGYLSVIEHWGSDERIVEAARMSTGKGFLGWGPTLTGQRIPCPNHDSVAWCARCGGPEGDRTIAEEKSGDEKLLRSLWENKHATPFEMGGLVIEVQAPIFVFREWHRHRTQSYNEMSARYIPLPDVNYVPSLERLMMGANVAASTGNKQAGTIADAAVLNPGAAEEFQGRLTDLDEHIQRIYEWALHIGIPKELARIRLPVGRYSRMRASANLRNWLAFLTLRNHAAAQWEIRQYAIALQDELTKIFPRTLALFTEGRP